MMVRKKTPKKVEITLLVATRRKCCLCVCLNDDWSEKRIQIAHIDRNNQNCLIENLAPLCLDHHDEYDSIFSQSKGIDPSELREYKNILIQKISKLDNNVELKNGFKIDESIIKDNSLSYMYSYGLFFAEVGIAMNRADPIGLALDGIPIHEYSIEVREIIDALIENNDNQEQDFKFIVNTTDKVMSQYFNGVYKSGVSQSVMYEDVYIAYLKFTNSITSIVFI